jgi:hypothetical protein
MSQQSFENSTTPEPHVLEGGNALDTPPPLEPARPLDRRPDGIDPVIVCPEENKVATIPEFKNAARVLFVNAINSDAAWLSKAVYRFGLGFCLCVLLAACGACGETKRVDLHNVAESQLTADEAVFEKSMTGYRAQDVDFTLPELAKHPHEARVFEALGYVRKTGSNLDLSPTGRTVAREIGGGRIAFDLERPHLLGSVRFTWETDEISCGEGREPLRTYGWDERVGPLTPLGSALVNNYSLYRGSWDERYKEHPYPWRDREKPLHELFSLYTDPVSRYPVTPIIPGGEVLAFKWSREFAEAGL